MGLSDLLCGKKVFGLAQAKRVESVEGAHIPTLKAVLKALDVPNVVASEIAQNVLIHRANIQSTSEASARIGAADSRDEKATEEAILAMRAARARRKQERFYSAQANTKIVADEQSAIVVLDTLRKYA